MKAVLATVGSFVIPGLGQLLYGEVLWSIVWLLLGLLTCGAANLFSALHVVMIASDRK
jgi:TM2 domain-containing membrane protein YozV